MNVPIVFVRNIKSVRSSKFMTMNNVPTIFEFVFWGIWKKMWRSINCSYKQIIKFIAFHLHCIKFYCEFIWLKVPIRSLWNILYKLCLLTKESSKIAKCSVCWRYNELRSLKIALDETEISNRTINLVSLDVYWSFLIGKHAPISTKSTA